MKFNIIREIKFFYSTLMSYSSFFGSLIFWTLTVIFLLILKQTRFALLFAIASLIAMGIEYTIKAFHKEKRPDFKKVSISSLYQKFQEGSTFPSGHSVNIALFTTMLHLEYGLILLTALFIIITLLVGLSRVSLQRHYTRDVIGGYVIGVLVALLLSLLHNIV